MARPSGQRDRRGRLVKDDIEGLALYHGKGGDYLVISSQGNDSYVVVDAKPPYRVRGSFQVSLDAQRGIDGARRPTAST